MILPPTSAEIKQSHPLLTGNTLLSLPAFFMILRSLFFLSNSTYFLSSFLIFIIFPGSWTLFLIPLYLVVCITDPTVMVCFKHELTASHYFCCIVCL